MHDLSRKRSFIAYAAGKSYAGGTMVRRDFEGRTFLDIQNGSQFKQPTQNVVAAAMNLSDGSTDLGVVIVVERLLHKVQKACLSLHDLQQRQSVTA